MSEEQYSALLPHLTFMEHIYECIDKSLPYSTPSRSVQGLCVDIYQKTDPNRKPVDWGCGACISEAIKTVTILFINHHKNKCK